MPLIDQAFAEFDLGRRTALAQHVMAYAHDTAQALFLYENVQFSAWGPGSRICRRTSASSASSI
jgi:hypothetical protein